MKLLNRNEDVDFDEEGRKLLARVHLLKNLEEEKKDNDNLTEEEITRKRRLLRYSNPIYKDPKTGGTIHVGNYMAAENLDHLNALRPAPCRRIVYCLNEVGTKPFDNNSEFTYFDFPIGLWRSILGDSRYDPVKVLEFFQPYFDFLDQELAQGNAILVHCLAGAHRAGTAGIASLMYLTGMNAADAIQTAQTLRPIIKPIGEFPKLLQVLEEGLEMKQKEQEAGKDQGTVDQQ